MKMKTSQECTMPLKENRRHITFVPVGGLANRMKGVNSAMALARKSNATLEIIWFTGWELNCPFHQLFAPIDGNVVTVKEATRLDYLIHDRPRRRNLYIPRIFQRFLFDKAMYESETAGHALKKSDFTVWCNMNTHYIAAFCDFCVEEESRKFGMFEPTKELEERIRENVNRFNVHTIGIHIRRTDNAIAIQKSPTNLFIKRMKEEIEREDTTRFFLATDSEEEKKTLQDIFGERIITSPHKADRNSVRGMQDAVVELYTLASTVHIIGCAGSTYAKTAAEIGKVGYESLLAANYSK